MKAKIAIIMGSDSDWPVMQKAVDVLAEFKIGYHAEVVSAHRTPEKMARFAKKAKTNGYEIIIAGAGGAAHLPGMVASQTSLPVIGVPIELKSLMGLDSLLSIAQMPTGVPVATMAVNNAGNAALFAARILSLKSKKIATQLETFQAGQSDKVKEMNRGLRQILSEPSQKSLAESLKSR